MSRWVRFESWKAEQYKPVLVHVKLHRPGKTADIVAEAYFAGEGADPTEGPWYWANQSAGEHGVEPIVFDGQILHVRHMPSPPP